MLEPTRKGPVTMVSDAPGMDGASDTTATQVGQRVAGLRQRAGADPSGAATDTWAWFTDLAAAGSKSEAELNELFRTGSPPTDLDGPTEGILVTTTTNKVLDPAVAAATKLWMPWQGKRFDASSGTGDNRITSSGRIASKLLWPLYSMKDAAEGKLAFDFHTYVDDGKDDPDRRVMVIDYKDVEKNPTLVIRSVRDELVEIVPGAYLGKILYRLSSGSHELIGFFALRTP